MNGSAVVRQTPRQQPWRAVAAWVAVALTPFVFIVGFVLGYALVGDPNEPTAPTGWDAAWRVVLLWIVVVAVSVVGMAIGVSARHRHETSATAAVVANAAVFTLLTVMTLVGGLVDAFN